MSLTLESHAGLNSWSGNVSITSRQEGKHVTSLKQGDRVVVYSRVFDGTCDICLKGYEMLCRNGGLIGVSTNGGFAEYIGEPEKNVFKIPDEMQWELAASLPVATLTPYHALKEDALKGATPEVACPSKLTEDTTMGGTVIPTRTRIIPVRGAQRTLNLLTFLVQNSFIIIVTRAHLSDLFRDLVPLR